MIVKTNRRLEVFTFTHVTGKEFRVFGETLALARRSAKRQAGAAGLRALDEDFLVK